MRAAISIYPLIENAIRGRRQHDVARHLRDMAALFERFAAVAAGNPLATRRDGFSAERLATIDADNRWIGFPYPRFMNSNAFIDQAAAFVMTSVEQATRLGIARDKWVFLHGCADAHDHWYVTERPDIAGSAAMRAGSELALDMAGKRVDELAFFDLYSCFPAAVEIAADRLGVAEDDPRGLTVTGGLPYFGGPGNNYVTHSICEMVRRVRGRSASFGLVTANGNYITKHSYGVYSTTPTLGRWQRQDPAQLQDSLDALPRQPFVEHADGAAIIETYTVMHDRSGPVQGIVIGRLDATGARFIANTAADAATLTRLRDEEHLGRPGFVTAGSDGRNHFVAS
jgi:acetyl-CoA C-acetyltransferase